MQHIHDNIPYLFDYCPDPGLHLLQLKSSMPRASLATQPIYRESSDPSGRHHVVGVLRHLVCDLVSLHHLRMLIMRAGLLVQPGYVLWLTFFIKIGLWWLSSGQRARLLL